MPNTIEEDYSKYAHEFAVWTTCRAVQRGFVKTELLKKVIEEVDLGGQIAELNKTKLDNDYFDRWHLVMATKMITAAKILIIKAATKNKKAGVEKNPKMTYGRAAKMIAIYIKTSQIIREPESRLARFAHPPVDMKLLSRLRREFKSEFGNTSYAPWTQFDENSYMGTIQILRIIQAKKSLKYFWMIEKYWTA